MWCPSSGDQVLEWNGRVLQGATFKEVYNIILESKPEPQVELVVSRPIGWVEAGDRSLFCTILSMSLQGHKAHFAWQCRFIKKDDLWELNIEMFAHPDTQRPFTKGFFLKLLLQEDILTCLKTVYFIIFQMWVVQVRQLNNVLTLWIDDI